MSNGDVRNKNIDISHLLAFLYDLTAMKDTARFISETRWKEGLGILHKRCYANFNIPVAFIVTRVAHAHQNVKNILASHLSSETLSEMTHIS